MPTSHKLLPHQEFFDRMKTLGCDTDELRQAYQQPALKAIRINPLKLPLDKAYVLPFRLSGVPFSPLGFTVEDDELRLGRSPWHHAGAFYVQEPAAMSAVTVLDPQPGERVLDMCAAPGGKSTQASALMQNRGLIWCNEYVRSRAQALISNIERMGITNAVVSSLHPDDLAEALEGFFDRVLVDAPCSGEGMFRKDEFAIHEWSVEHVRTCALRQAAILDSAARCLRPGGVLVYSTCTFSREENEDNIAAFLERNPDFHIESVPQSFGRPGINASSSFDLTLTRRIYPMDGGEGHFVARMRREGEPVRRTDDSAVDESVPDGFAKLLSDCFFQPMKGTAKQIGENIYIIPQGYPEQSRLTVLRAGVLAGTVKKNRIEPAHALFMAEKADNCRCAASFEYDSTEIDSFLHGEELSVPDDLHGWCAVACGGIVTGFGKCSDGTLKNRYPKGLRLLN